MQTTIILPIIRDGFLLSKGKKSMSNPVKICKNIHCTEGCRERKIHERVEKYTPKERLSLKKYLMTMRIIPNGNMNKKFGLN